MRNVSRRSMRYGGLGLAFLALGILRFLFGNGVLG
jgi:hypothetical protein